MVHANSSVLSPPISCCCVNTRVKMHSRRDMGAWRTVGARRLHIRWAEGGAGGLMLKRTSRKIWRSIWLPAARRRWVDAIGCTCSGKEEGTTHVLQQFALMPTQEAQASYQQAMATTPEDICRLDHGKWLNDQVINMCMALLQVRMGLRYVHTHP